MFTIEVPVMEQNAARPEDPFGSLDSEEVGDVTLTDRAYRLIEELITTLQLPPGTTLTEQVLAKRLDIGRTPIREALQRLVRDGLVIIIPRRGILVSDINLKTQLRLLETRRVVESLMAGLAATRADDQERQRFALIGARMREAALNGDDLAFMRLDRAFNQLLAQSARNEFALRAMALMTPLCRRFWFQHYRDAADLPLAARLHADIAQAIAAGERETAVQGTERLLDYIEAFTRTTLDQ